MSKKCGSTASNRSSRKKSGCKRLFRIFSIIICFVCALTPILFVYFNRSFSYQAEIYAADYASNYLNSIVNRAVENAILNADYDFSSLVNISTDEAGRVASVTSGMVGVTVLKSRLDRTLAEELMKDTEFVVSIPIGNILGSHVFYGKGIKLPIRITVSTDTNTKMTGSLAAAGINQSLYRISFDVNSIARIIYPFHYTESPVRCEVVLSETVIVGDVPDAYTEFKLDGDITGTELQGYVEDYGAETSK